VRHFARLEFPVAVIFTVVVIRAVVAGVVVAVFVLGLRLARVQPVELLELIGVRQVLGQDCSPLDSPLVSSGPRRKCGADAQHRIGLP